MTTTRRCLPTGRVRHPALIVSLVLLGAMAMALLTSVEQSSSSEESSTTTLYPGWNLIGWIHESTLISDLFAEIDELAAVHDGLERSALRQGSGYGDSLLRLETGRGYWFRIDHDEPVGWTRPAAESSRRFRLSPSRRLVAWNGRDPVAVETALVPIGQDIAVAWRWDAQDQQFIPWSPDPRAPNLVQPMLRRGDALLLDAFNRTEWNQLSGGLPVIAYPGGLHDDLPEDFENLVASDVMWLIDHVADRFGVAVDPDRLEVRIPTTEDSARQEHETYRGSRISRAFAATASQTGTNHIIVVPTGKWGYRSGDGRWIKLDARPSLAFTYFSALQDELSQGAWSQAPWWLIVGAPTWFGYSVEGRQLGVNQVQHFTAQLDLRQAAPPNETAHDVGVAAVSILIERSGERPIVDFWRSLAADEAIVPWEAAFFETFGFTPGEFYGQFYNLRRPRFTVIHGQVRTPGETPPPLWIKAISDQGTRTRSGQTFGVQPDPDGSFELVLPRFHEDPEAPIRWGLTIALRTASRHDTAFFLTGCTAKVGADHAPDPSPNPRAWLFVEPGESIDNFELHVPDTFCRHWIRVRLPDAVAEAFGSAYAVLCDDTGSCAAERRNAAGVNNIRLPLPGEYVMSMTRRCGPDGSIKQTLYVADGRMTTDRAEAIRFTSQLDPSIISLRVELPLPACTTP